MNFLLLLVFLAAGALIGWLTIIGGIWFLMPIFLICAAIVSIRLENAVRWRIAAFSVGAFVVFGLAANQLVQSLSATDRQLKNHKVTVPTPVPRAGGGLMSG